jgi:TIR domain/inactive STAND
MSDEDKGHVFISFTSDDKEIVVPVVKRLRRRFVVWTYLENLGGIRYPPVIEEKIRTCSVFVVMVSRKAAESEDVQQEVQLAFKHKRIRLPVVIDPTAKDAFGYQTTGIVRISLFKGIEDPNFSQLVASIAAGNPQRRSRKSSTRTEPAEDLGWLRPHLVDRTNQELVLNRYVQAVLERRIARPGFFLLRGREDECGDVFIERVARHAVPKALREAALREYVHLDQVVWPDHRDDIENTTEAADARYDALLGSAEEALARARQRAAQGTVLRVQLPVDDWRPGDRVLLEKFLSWWRDSHHDLPARSPIVVIAYVSYGAGVVGPWWRRWVLRRTDRVFESQNPRRVSNEARPVAALPLLAGVSQTDAMNWVHEHQAILKEPDPKDARLALAPHFRRRLGLGNRRIPMQNAVKALGSLLRDASASGAPT